MADNKDTKQVDTDDDKVQIDQNLVAPTDLLEDILNTLENKTQKRGAAEIVRRLRTNAQT